MSTFSFSLDYLAVFLIIPLLILSYFLYCWQKNYPNPQIHIPDLSAFLDPSKAVTINSPINSKERFASLPKQLYIGALLLFLLAFAHPRFSYEKKAEIPIKSTELQNENFATEGLAIYLVLDRSSSMAGKVTARLSDGQLTSLPKTALLTTSTESFIVGNSAEGITGRANDLIGIVEFARAAHVVVPLTLDRKELLSKISSFQIVSKPEEDGTAIGYAMLKTAQVIAATKNFAKDLLGKGKPAYEIKGAVIILLTDGLQDPHPEDRHSRWRQIDPLEAAKFAKENNIHVYIVNVEPKLAAEKYAANRRQLEAAAKLTGGKFFLMNSSGNLSEIYQNINQLEKSPIALNHELAQKLQRLSNEKYDSYNLYPYLIALALSCLLIGLFLDTVILRRAP